MRAKAVLWIGLRLVLMVGGIPGAWGQTLGYSAQEEGGLRKQYDENKEFNYDSYRAYTIPQVELEYQDLGDSTGSQLLFDPYAKYLIRGTYTGEWREIQPDLKKFIALFLRGIGSPELDEAFRHEIRLRHAGEAYWLPIQEVLIPHIKSELSVGDNADFYVVFTGKIMERYLFLINEFQKTEDQERDPPVRQANQSLESLISEAEQCYYQSDTGAIRACIRALKVAEELHNRQLTGAISNNLGHIFYELGNHEAAFKYYRKALENLRGAIDREKEQEILTVLGQTSSALGNLSGALQYHEQALAIQREQPNRKAEAITFNNLGIVWGELGNYSRAIEYLWQAHAVFKKIPDQDGIGSSLGELGILYEELGDFATAEKLYGQALAISRAIPDKEMEGKVLNNLGALHISYGNLSQALRYFQDALEIFREFRSADNIQTAQANIGSVYMEQGEFQKALEIFKRVDNPIRLGQYYLKKGHARQALVEFSRTLWQAEKERKADILVAGYIGLGLAHEELKEYAKAREYYQKAVDFIERQRESLTEPQRHHFFTAKVISFPRIEPYEGLARVSVHLKDAAAGAYWAEHTKARLLLEVLARHGTENTLGLPKELAQQETELTNRIASIYKQMDIAFKQDNQERYHELEQELPKLKTEQEAFIARLRKGYPEYAAVRYPQPIRMEDMRLEPNEVLIEYEVTEATTFAWLIRAGKVLKTLTIPVTRQALEEQVRRYRGFFEASSAAELARQLPAFDPKLGKALYDQLFAELAPFIKEDDQIILIPDEILGILPFEALVRELPAEVKAAAGKYGPYPEGVRYLGEVYALSYAQSATALRQTRALKQTKGEKGKPLLVVADPVFDERGDERVRQARREGQTLRLAQGSSPINLMAAAKDFEKVVLNRLDATARLPGQLRRLYEEIDVLTGFEASEPQVKQYLPRSYRYQVLATHGILNGQVPYIQEPALVLSQVVSPASQEEDPTPGFLTLTEVMNLKLNTDLVALTACSTGVGKQVTGEGVMGLGRAFQYAGARGVLMSLWNVDEASTVLLVERFFSYLQQGKHTLEALRLARTEVRQAGYEHPFFWAPFILVGAR